jgi:hypothetical protein
MMHLDSDHHGAPRLDVSAVPTITAIDAPAPGTSENALG